MSTPRLGDGVPGSIYAPIPNHSSEVSHVLVAVKTGCDGADTLYSRRIIVQHSGHDEARHADDVMSVAKEDVQAARVTNVWDGHDPDVASRDGLADEEIWKETAAALVGEEEEEASAAIDELPWPASGTAG